MLTDEQIRLRAGKLTGSRIAVLMNGDAAGILRLYQEMIGEAEPENLDHVWPVQLGSATEQLNLDWYERKNCPVIRRGEVVFHRRFDWAAVTLDGWESVLYCPFEAKHVGGREPLEIIIDRYQPQMQWLMECTDTTQCVLSVIMGANEPIVEFIQRDAEYAEEMVRRGAQFMEFVRRLIPPVTLPAVPPPADASKFYDMQGNNRWADNAATWLETSGAAVSNKDAEKILKSLVPADAKKCSGHNIQITRDRAGRLSLRRAA